MQEQLSAKVCILGSSGVGKTCLTVRFVEDTWSENTVPTIGSFFLAKRVQVDPKNSLSLKIWDTAGQERFRCISPMYYRGSMGALLVYDLTSLPSLMEVKNWVQELRSAGQSPEIGIVGNKCDLPDRHVRRESAEVYAAQIGAFYIETSAKTGEGVQEAFTQLGKRIMKNKKRELLEQGGEDGVGGSFLIKEEPTPKPSTCSC